MVIYLRQKFQKMHGSNQARTVLAITLWIEAQNYYMLRDATVAFQSQCYEFKQRKNRLFVFENQYTGTASALICAVKSRI